MNDVAICRYPSFTMAGPFVGLEISTRGGGRSGFATFGAAANFRRRRQSAGAKFWCRRRLFGNANENEALGRKVLDRNLKCRGTVFRRLVKSEVSLRSRGTRWTSCNDFAKQRNETRMLMIKASGSRWLKENYFRCAGWLGQRVSLESRGK